MNRVLRAVALSFTLLTFLPAFADEPIPDCLAKGKRLGVNNAQVRKWKATTRTQFLARAHVSGRVTRLYPTRTGHAHFQMELEGGETLEVVYSLAFGNLPKKIPLGTDVEACGDYITSNAPTSKYPTPSPDGALIHWIHRSDSRSHESGYLALDGRVFGGLGER